MWGRSPGADSDHHWPHVKSQMIWAYSLIRKEHQGHGSHQALLWAGLVWDDVAWWPHRFTPSPQAKDLLLGWILDRSWHQQTHLSCTHKRREKHIGAVFTVWLRTCGLLDHTTGFGSVLWDAQCTTWQTGPFLFHVLGQHLRSWPKAQLLLSHTRNKRLFDHFTTGTQGTALKNKYQVNEDHSTVM